MSEVVPDTQQEFWRPPVLAQALVTVPAAPTSPIIAAGTCVDCQTEFMSGSNFCYVCGATRATETQTLQWHDRFLRIFGFHNIKQTLGLPVASLVGFFAGMACLIAAVSVGRAISAQTTAEFQAVQLLRIEWLLGSVAAFLAGILLKHVGEE